VPDQRERSKVLDRMRGHALSPRRWTKSGDPVPEA